MQAARRGLTQGGPPQAASRIEMRCMDTDNYFGRCPTCGMNDGRLDIGPDHWFVCHVHKVAWYIGSNLFSSWRRQTKEQRQRIEERLRDYRELSLDEVRFGED